MDDLLLDLDLLYPPFPTQFVRSVFISLVPSFSHPSARVRPTHVNGLGDRCGPAVPASSIVNFLPWRKQNYFSSERA